MSFHGKGDKSLSTLRDEMAAVVAKAQASVYGTGPVEHMATEAIEKILSNIESADSWDPVIAALSKSIQDAEKLQALLRDMLRQVEYLEESRAQRERFGERWWRRKSRQLNETFQRNPQEGLVEWIRASAETLIAWELDALDRLVCEPFPFPSEAACIVSLFQRGAKDFKEESYERSLALATFLAHFTPANQSEPLLDAHSRATLHIITGRIHHYSSNEEEALKHFEQARELAPDDGRPSAAIGNYHRGRSDDYESLKFYQQAVEQSPDQPDGYVGLGMLSVDQKRWQEAEEWYERAIDVARREKDIDAALRKYFAPVSGNLYLKLARTLIEEDPEAALAAVTLALDLGILGEGSYPEKKGYHLKGELLEKLNRPVEAAQSYFEAGQRYNWDNEGQAACEPLKRAKALDPNNRLVYWDLSDALRLASYLKEPPYVDKEKIDQSLAEWKAGADAGMPDATKSWAYITRALINEQLARLHWDDRVSLWWESIAYVEWALLHDSGVYNWAYLGRFYRLLIADSNALHATSKALENDPENLAALEERALILSNVRDFKPAMEAIEKLEGIDPGVWVRGLKAYALLYNGQHENALKVLDEIIEAVPTDLWYRDIRAFCYLRLSEKQKSEQDYQWIWERRDDERYNREADNRNAFGWAAYNLGKLDEAIDIFNQLLGDPVLAGISYRNMGLCYLSQGKPDPAKSSLLEGIRQASRATEMDDLLFDIEDWKKYSTAHSDEASIAEAVKTVEDAIEARRGELKSRPSAEEELLRLAADLDRDGRKGDWTWIGIKAGLARFCAEKELWTDAATIYSELQKEAGHFGASRLGLENVMDSLREEGERLLEDEKPREAAERFKEALSTVSSLLADDNNRQAHLHCLLGYAHSRLGETAMARENFTRSLELYREAGLTNPGLALGDACRSLIRNAAQYWALDDEWSAFEGESSADAYLIGELASARGQLAIFLDEKYQLSGQIESEYDREPIVTPIVVEIGAALIPEDTGPEWPLVKTYLPDTRNRIFRDMGVWVPAIYLRSNDPYLPRESYIIMLDEIPLRMGEVRSGMKYCLTSAEALKEAGLPVEELQEAAHPLTGEAGCWIPANSAEVAAGKGFEVWDDPLLYMVAHIEDVLRQNLAEFLGIQEVEYLIAGWEQSDKCSLVIAALPDEVTRIRLARVLGALLKEGVSIAPWEEILETIRSFGLSDDDVTKVVSAVRLRLKKWLPGNRENVARISLPVEIEDRIHNGLYSEEGKTFLALTPEETQELLSEVRSLVDSTSRNQAIITGSAELRPYVRRVLEIEFPDLAVLSDEELIEADADIAQGGETSA